MYTHFIHQGDEGREGAPDFVCSYFTGVHGSNGVHDAVAEPGEHPSGVQHTHGVGDDDQDPADYEWYCSK